MDFPNCGSSLAWPRLCSFCSPEGASAKKLRSLNWTAENKDASEWVVPFLCGKPILFEDHCCATGFMIGPFFLLCCVLVCKHVLNRLFFERVLCRASRSITTGAVDIYTLVMYSRHERLGKSHRIRCTSHLTVAHVGCSWDTSSQQS